MDVTDNSPCFSRLLLLPFFFLIFCTKAYSIEVFVNNSINLSEISKQQLKSIYLGQQTHWPNGKLIKLFKLPSEHKTHKNFVKGILGLYPYQYNRRWQKLVFSGFAIKPKEALTEQELLHAVAKTSGAIGYIEKKTLIEGISYVEVYE